MSIYFVQLDSAPERVKIGKAHDTKRRLYELSRYPSSAWKDQAEHASGAQLVLRANCEGYAATEAALHHMLKGHRLHGEWFDATAPIVAQLLAYVTAHQSLEAIVPEQVRVDRARACTHDAVRAMHPEGRCLLCDVDADIAPVFATSVPTPSADEVQAALLATSGATHETAIDQDEQDRAALAEELQAYLDACEAELARRSLAEFFRQAVKAGVVPGLRNVEWAPHLEATCMHVQMILEGWLVTQGMGTDDMIARQADAWALHFRSETELAMVTGSTEPWLTEPLVQKMIENLCPATLKSTVAMVIANAWLWLHAPWAQFGALSWVDMNVTRDSDATRDLVTSAWYRDRFAIEWSIRSDQDSKKLWSNTAGGKRVSVSMQSGIVGTHVHVIFIDDPDDPILVHQESKRVLVHNRFFDSCENRLHDERTGVIFILQQRTHVMDLSGACLAKGQWSPTDRKLWAWLCIPLRYGRAPTSAPKRTPYGWKDWRTERDACMMPSRFPPAVVADKMRSGEFFFATQYDQNPTPLIGGLFPRDRLRFFIYADEAQLMASWKPRPIGCTPRSEDPPIVLNRNQYGRPQGLDTILISVDATFGSTKQTASQVGITVYGWRKEEMFALEDRTRIMGVDEQYDAVIMACAEWAPTCQTLIVESKALGDAVIDAVEKVLRTGEWRGKKLRGQNGQPLRIRIERVSVGSNEGKLIRARSAVPTWNARLVYVHEGATWIHPKYDDRGKTLDAGWIAEVCAHPNGDKNDRGDCFSQAVAWKRDANEVIRGTRALNTL